MLKAVSFTDKYLPEFEALSPQKAEVLHFHGDVIPGSAAAIVRIPSGVPVKKAPAEGTFIGAGFLQGGQSYVARKTHPELPFYSVQMDLALDFSDPEAVPAAEMLIEELAARCAALREEEPEKKLALTYWVRTDARESRAFLESLGFREAYRTYRMAREIGEEEPPVEDPEVTEIDLGDPEVLKRYLEWTEESYGVPETDADTRFRLLRQGARVFTIGEKSFVTVWDLGNGDAATENVFTRKAFRRRGLSKRLMEEVSRLLREEGFERLFLNVYPKFAAGALRMYRSLGYERVYTLIEMHKMI